MSDADPFEEKKQSVVVKVGMLGDVQTGKTTMMVKYCENRFDSDYIMTVGVSFMERMVPVGNVNVTFSIWDLGGSEEYTHMLPIVCNDSMALLFIFDLCRKGTLVQIKEWYRKARKINKNMVPILVGTKYDMFATTSPEEQKETVKLARKYAKAMKAALVFTSSSHAINVEKLFLIILSKVFQTECFVPKITKVGDPLIEY